MTRRRSSVAPRVTIARVVAVLAPLATGCGAASSHGEAQRAPIVGNDAVRARLAPLPELTFPASTEIRAASLDDLRAYCAWQARAVGSYDVEASCRDGSTVRISTACGEDDLEAMHEGLAECPMTIGEWAACTVARRADACQGGMFGERLPECEAFSACISAAMEEGEAEGQPPVEAAAPASP